MAKAEEATPEAAGTTDGADDLTECSVRAVDPVRIAVLFHGTMGTLRHTLPSIQTNLLAPLLSMAHGATLDSFAHLVDTHVSAAPVPRVPRGPCPVPRMPCAPCPVSHACPVPRPKDGCRGHTLCHVPKVVVTLQHSSTLQQLDTATQFDTATAHSACFS